MRQLLCMSIAAIMVCGCGKGVLYPQLEPNSGNFSDPASKVGDKPKDPWTLTTHQSAVKGFTPNSGEVVTLVGEVIDLSCYLQLGKHGKSHRDCAQKCMRNGQPIALLTKEGAIYLLMEEEHDPRRDSKTNLRAKCIELAADIVEVTGTLAKINGYNGLFVHGFLEK